MNEPQWLLWSRRLHAIAQSGLTYCTNPFDLERYEALQRIAAEIMAAGAGISDASIIHGLFQRDVGYCTPKVDVRGAVFDEGRILLVREREDGGWTLPGGWADIDHTPAENVVREVREESGYDVKVTKLAAVLDRTRQGHPPIPWYTYKLFFLCELIGGTAKTSKETDGAAFFAEDEIPPLSLSRVNPAQIRQMYEHHRNPGLPAAYD